MSKLCSCPTDIKGVLSTTVLSAVGAIEPEDLGDTVRDG